jgi:hypothetical protein
LPAIFFKPGHKSTKIVAALRHTAVIATSGHGALS